MRATPPSREATYAFKRITSCGNFLMRTSTLTTTKFVLYFDEADSKYLDIDWESFEKKFECTLKVRMPHRCPQAVIFRVETARVNLRIARNSLFTLVSQHLNSLGVDHVSCPGYEEEEYGASFHYIWPRRKNGVCNPTMDSDSLRQVPSTSTPSKVTAEADNGKTAAKKKPLPPCDCSFRRRFEARFCKEPEPGDPDQIVIITPLPRCPCGRRPPRRNRVNQAHGFESLDDFEKTASTSRSVSSADPNAFRHPGGHYCQAERMLGIHPKDCSCGQP
ncbi:unnamed protein product [Caenorhabditis auriculariae]|uniref:Uncharacterized protein n=1 Tax=Caenorhabditis auriculariae TaxID=2777116 RepID=A0A8S1GZR4_9PELO|nr:unnamed protein product [Caenorhabditis auriculariae]